MKHLALSSLLLFAACGGGDSGDGSFVGDLAAGDLVGAPSADGALAPLRYTTDVTITVEPEDEGQTLVSAITNAKTSIHMTMYELSDNPVINGIIAQTKAGLDVKVLLNQTVPDDGGSSTQVFSQLSSAGVAVKYAPSRYQYTHEKSLVLDGSTALIMTMNAASSAFTGNREYLATDTDSDDVTETEAIFEADWANVPTATFGKLVTAPDNAEERLVQLVDTATSTVDLEGEVFSSNAMLMAIGRAVSRKVTVRVVLSDETPTSAQTTAVMGMKQVGIPCVTVHDPDIHAKAIVIDGSHAYVGSENFTSNSLENNRELGVLISKQSEVDKVASTIDADFKAGKAL
jgi:cardiolipin synthase